MLTRRELIIAKAEYLLGRSLTDKERKVLLSKIKVGNMKELKDNLPEKKNDFIPVETVVASKFITDKTSEEELKEIVKEIAIKSMSVESGLKVMSAAKTQKPKGLLKYIFNLYTRDALNREKKMKKTAEGREPILQSPPLLTGPHTEDLAWAYLSYYNPDQDNHPSKVNEYTDKGYLHNEWHTRPSQNEYRKKEKPKNRLKRYIKQMIGKPTPEEPTTRGGKS